MNKEIFWFQEIVKMIPILLFQRSFPLTYKHVFHDPSEILSMNYGEN